MKPLHISMKSVSTLLLFLLITACDFGPKPDKVIEITLQLDEAVNSDQEMNAIVQKLHQRLKRVTKNPEIIPLSGKNQIKIKALTFYEISRLQNYMINPGKLEFYETYKNEEMISFLAEVNELVRNEDSIVNPFYNLIKESGYKGGAILFSVEEKDTATVNEYFSMKAAE